MADCPECGRLLDDGECARCAVVNGVVETAEAPSDMETAASKRPARKAAREKR